MTDFDRGMVVPEFSFDFQEPSACIDELAESVGYQWYIDENKNVHFFWVESFDSPLTVVRDNLYNVETELEHCWDLEIDFDVSQIKNRVIMKNPNFKGTYINEDFVGAQKRFFASLYNPYPFDQSASQDDRQELVSAAIHKMSTDGEIDLTQYQMIALVKLDDIEGRAEREMTQ